jgi:succinoglycan biosynthesis transport protein ExoP
VVPGKKYKPEDFVMILWRRRWMVLVPLVLMTAGAFVYSQSLPNRYRSQAVILIIPPAVSSQIAKPIVAEPLTARLDSLGQRLLSRPQLQRLIEQFDLYPEERKTHFMEEIVSRMQRDVSLDVAKPVARRLDPNQFTVSYVSSNAQTAMQVTKHISELFVDANLEDRELRTGSTNDFLQAQLDEKRRNLDEQQRKVEAFRAAHNGTLPSQLSSNLQYITAAQEEIRQLIDGIGRDSDRRVLLEQLITDAESAPSTARVTADGGGTAAQQLEAARAALRGMELRLTPDHPDIGIAKRRIQELERKADAEALQQPVSGAVTAASPGDAARQTRLIQMRAELDGANRRISSAQSRIKTLEGSIALRRGLVSETPSTETDLATLERDLSTLQASYEALVRKAEETRISSNMERRQVSEQFRIVDPARLPARPSGPNRLRYTGLGFGAGLGLGLIIVGLLEYRDTSLRTMEDVVVALSLPVVALVPTMTTAAERKRAVRHRVILAVAFLGSVALMTAVALLFKSQLYDFLAR